MTLYGAAAAWPTAATTNADLKSIANEDKLCQAKISNAWQKTNLSD
jgi:hypothetical protein